MKTTEPQHPKPRIATEIADGTKAVIVDTNNPAELPANVNALDVTAIIDHHESPNAIDGSLSVIADACAEVGVRALVCYGAYLQGGARSCGRVRSPGARTRA